ncbi:MAG: sulfatase [Cyclobacteriaceae bacterium]
MTNLKCDYFLVFRHFWLIVSVFFIYACQSQKPNVVFILVDDLGWSDLGYSGSTFHETPNIDAFSKTSIQFTNAYASGSVCSPSRAAIMTGKHPARLNITDWIPGAIPKGTKLKGPDILNELPLAETTLAEVFRQNGYATFFAGKWHLGDEGFFPEDQGFDINLGGHHRGSPPGGYYSPYKNPKLSDGIEGEYLTDRLTSEAISFLDSSGDDPFFLYLPYYTVHTPIQPNLEYIEKFEKKLPAMSLGEMKTKEERDGITVLEQRNPAYASMLYALDKNIGRLIEGLKQKGIYDNTIVVFTSDNGGLSTLHKNRKLAPTAVLPLRGGKGWLYEGGIRVPLLIKPIDYNEVSRVTDAPVVGHDFYPTLLSMAGISSHENHAMDGIDLEPLLSGSNEISRTGLFWHYPHYHGSAWTPGAAIRSGKWKLIEFFETNTIELYNLDEDISEMNDLSDQFPAKVKELTERLHELQKSVGAKGVVDNPEFTGI